MSAIEVGSSEHFKISLPLVDQQPDFSDDILPVKGFVPSGEIVLSNIQNPNRFTKVKFAAGGFVAGGLTLLGACGGGDGNEKTTILGATAEPTSTLQPGKTEVIVVLPPTIEPTKTSEPTPTPIPEKIPTVKEVSTMVSQALSSYKENIVAKEALGYIEQGAVKYDTLSNTSSSTTTNSFGQGGKALIKLACQMPDNKELADASLAVKAFTLDIVKTFEENGIFEKGSVSNATKFFFSIPADCVNQYLIPKTK